MRIKGVKRKATRCVCSHNPRHYVTWHVFAGAHLASRGSYLSLERTLLGVLPQDPLLCFGTSRCRREGEESIPLSYCAIGVITSRRIRVGDAHPRQIWLLYRHDIDDYSRAKSQVIRHRVTVLEVAFEGRRNRHICHTVTMVIGRSSLRCADLDSKRRTGNNGLPQAI